MLLMLLKNIAHINTHTINLYFKQCLFIYNVKYMIPGERYIIYYITVSVLLKQTL